MSSRKHQTILRGQSVYFCAEIKKKIACLSAKAINQPAVTRASDLINNSLIESLLISTPNCYRITVTVVYSKVSVVNTSTFTLEINNLRCYFSFAIKGVHKESHL